MAAGPVSEGWSLELAPGVVAGAGAGSTTRRTAAAPQQRHLFGHGQACTALPGGRSQGTCKVHVCCEDSPPDSLTNVVQEDLLGGMNAGHVLQSDAIDGESSGEKEPGAAGLFGSLITERDIIARYSLMHYKHPDCTVGRITKARLAGTGWEAMIVWYMLTAWPSP